MFCSMASFEMASFEIYILIEIFDNEIWKI